MALTGTCKSWRGDKGFGFISADDGSEVFMHVQSCTDGGIPQAGDTLTFDVEDSAKKPGQVQAKNVSGGTGKPEEKGAGKGGKAGKAGPPGANSGQVKSFNAEKGFGFIIGADGTDLFCHLHAVVDGSVPQTGDTITYDIEPSRSKPGQFTACNVQGGTGSQPKGGKGGGKDYGWGGGGYGASKGDSWDGGGKMGPYGGGKGMEKGWGKSEKGWGKDAWAAGGGKGWGDDGWGGGGKGGYDAWGGAGAKGGYDSWGGDGGKGKGKGWGGDGGKGKGSVKGGW